MQSLSLFPLLKVEQFCQTVDLFTLAPAPKDQRFGNAIDGATTRLKNSHRRGSDSSESQGRPVHLVIDSESCLDRLYGGYYADWASGGQWNRMIGYVSNLAKACEDHHLKLTVAVRGGVEKEHAQSLFKRNRDFRDRLNRVMSHLQNRGTPPPKVWWLPPTCLREVLCLALRFYGISVLCTSDDYYRELKMFVKTSGAAGILSDDSMFFLLGFPRLFAAHDMKLTYKGNLETKEFMISKWMECNNLSRDHMCLLASLLGNHILPVEYLKEFHDDITIDKSSKGSEELEKSIVEGLIQFTRSFPDPTNIEAFGNVVFRNSSVSMDLCLCKLNESVDYFKQVMAGDTVLPSKPIKTKLDLFPRSSSSTSTTDEKDNSIVSATSQVTRTADESSLEGATEALTLNPSSKTKSQNGATPISIAIEPSEAVLKPCLERHHKGLMAPIIMQALIERHVRLPIYIENVHAPDERQQSVIMIFRPIRQSVYAILHNLNKHLYDSKKLAEETGHTVLPDEININITESYLSTLGVECHDDLKVTPVSWPVPSLESLWLGVKPENKARRMKAFLSCMQAGSDPLITNISHVPERFLMLCSVLRYLLRCEPAVLTLQEIDAVLAMATSQVLFDVQTMQDMQLPLITPRGAHIASVIMAGIQHAMLVNDVCGAPIRKEITAPWLFFDGKLFQYKLLKATSSHPVQRLDLCDGQMAQLIQMERLRQAVLHGLHDKFGDAMLCTPMHVLAPSSQHVFAPPAAYLRPSATLSSNRGKGTLTGEYLPMSSPLDNRGGKLQIAGQVVATWGPRPVPEKQGGGAANSSPTGHNSNYKEPTANRSESAAKSSKKKPDKKVQNNKKPSNDGKNSKASPRTQHTNNRRKQTQNGKPGQRSPTDEQVHVQVVPDKQPNSPVSSSLNNSAAMSNGGAEI